MLFDTFSNTFSYRRNWILKIQFLLLYFLCRKTGESEVIKKGGKIKKPEKQVHQSERKIPDSCLKLRTMGKSL